MRCPKCAYERIPEANECPKCGVIYSRYRPKQERQPQQPSSFQHQSPQTQQVQQPKAMGFDAQKLKTWLKLPEKKVLHRTMIGSLAGLLVYIIGPLKFILSYLVILIHEIGHAATWWLFGYPAIPAFDFVYGGGVTMHVNRSYLLLILLFAGGASLFYFLREHKKLLIPWGMVFALWLIMAVTPIHDHLCIAMGHGAELLFLILCFYRATTGSGLRIEVERPLYAMIGTFIFIKSIVFSIKLMFSATFRYEYGAAKGGGHWMDFSRLANETFLPSVQVVAFFFLIATLIAPLLSYALFVWRTRHLELTVESEEAVKAYHRGLGIEHEQAQSEESPFMFTEPPQEQTGFNPYGQAPQAPMDFDPFGEPPQEATDFDPFIDPSEISQMEKNQKTKTTDDENPFEFRSPDDRW